MHLAAQRCQADKRLSGQYTPVFCSEAINLAIHTEETLPFAQGTVSSSGNLAWVSGFAKSEQEAQDKADLLIKKAKLRN